MTLIVTVSSFLSRFCWNDSSSPEDGRGLPRLPRTCSQQHLEKRKVSNSLFKQDRYLPSSSAKPCLLKGSDCGQVFSGSRTQWLRACDLKNLLCTRFKGKENFRRYKIMVTYSYIYIFFFFCIATKDVQLCIPWHEPQLLSKDLSF